MTAEFEILAATQWGQKHARRLKKFFRGVESDWKKQSLSELRIALRTQLMDCQRARCAYCRVPLVDVAGHREIDHIVPKSIAVQFLYLRKNLVLTCKRCNQRKKHHNPTVHSDQHLARRVRYPSRPRDYIWVHPFLHRYSDHIVRVRGYIYQAVNGSAEGVAVIEVCGLSEIKEVLARHRQAIALSAATPMSALLQIVGSQPGVPATEIARELVSQKRIALSVAEATELIDKLRGANPIEVLIALR